MKMKLSKTLLDLITLKVQEKTLQSKYREKFDGHYTKIEKNLPPKKT